MSAWLTGYKPMFQPSIVIVPHSQMLTSLRLHNFRCFEGVSVDIGPGLNLFFGGNGEGKTTILEGACVLLRLQSQRSASLAPVIQIGKKSFGVRGRFDEHELEFRYRALRRQVRFDGIEQRTLGEYLRLGRVVSLANVDIELVRGGSDARRRYLDFLGLQIDNAYRPALRAYERALRARNALLKSPTARPREIAAYDAPLIQHGQILLRLRGELSELLAPHAAHAYQRISRTAKNSRSNLSPVPAPISKAISNGRIANPFACGKRWLVLIATIWSYASTISRRRSLVRKDSSAASCWQ